MKLKRIADYPGKFQVILSTRSSQAAMMTLRPGEMSDDEISNEHPRSEQWVYVIAGSGTARIRSVDRTRSQKLRAGSVLLIEKGDRHQIENTGRRSWRTLNFYVPPAYSPDGEVKKRAT